MSGLKGRIEAIERRMGDPLFVGRLACIRPTESDVGPFSDPGAAPGAIVRSEDGPGLFHDVPCTYLYVHADHRADPVAGLSWRQRESLRPEDRVIVEWWDHDPATGVLSVPGPGDSGMPPSWAEVMAGRDPLRN